MNILAFGDGYWHLQYFTEFGLLKINYHLPMGNQNIEYYNKKDIHECKSLSRYNIEFDYDAFNET